MLVIGVDLYVYRKVFRGFTEDVYEPYETGCYPRQASL